MSKKTIASKRRKVEEKLRTSLSDSPKEKSDPLLGFVCAQLPEDDLGEDCAAFQEKPEVKRAPLEKPVRKRKVPSESQKFPKVEPKIEILPAEALDLSQMPEESAERPIDDMRDLIGNSGVGSIGDFDLI